MSLCLKALPSILSGERTPLLHPFRGAQYSADKQRIIVCDARSFVSFSAANGTIDELWLEGRSNLIQQQEDVWRIYHFDNSNEPWKRSSGM